MTAKELCGALGASVLAGEKGLDSLVTGCYIGDLLSWVMGRAKEGDVWITVMGNVNAVAVAKLAELSCILLCEDSHLDEEARQQADMNAIPVLACGEPAYELALRVAGLMP